MAIKRYKAEADNTITNAFDTLLASRGTGSNAGANDVVETFSIYGQYASGSTELSRILIKFPVTGTTGIKADRAAGTIPASGSATFYLRLFNARHSEQIPENLTLSIFPIAKAWEEGTGIDIVNHSDKTKDALPGSNWDNRTKGVAWTRDGGDYLSGSAYSTSSFTASFVTGSEDLEVDVTALVEEWIATNVVATGSVTISALAEINNGDKVTLVATDGTSHDFTAGDVAGGGTWIVETDNNTTATNLAAQINASAKFSASAPAALVTIHQATAGAQGNTTITLTDSGVAGMTKSDFASGTGLDDYGFGIMLTSSQEAYFSSSGGDTGSELQNTGGQQQSFYTKRFFARSSEYFFKRPVIEVRWDDRISDDRNKFYASSSAIANNANNLYLYNYVNGALVDFPTDDAGAVTVNLYASSGSAPSGSAVAEVTTTKVSTGVYKAVVTVSTTESVLHDVWFLPGAVAAHTGTISVRTRSISNSNEYPQYASNITNLRDAYSNKETARFRVFARRRNFEPTLYTVANSVVQGETVVSASYSIIRIIDDETMFAHGTGSATKHTHMSYDNSGSYFDFDMSLLEPGYMYGVKLAYYVANAWREQEETFKFRVER